MPLFRPPEGGRYSRPSRVSMRVRKEEVKTESARSAGRAAHRRGGRLRGGAFARAARILMIVAPRSCICSDSRRSHRRAVGRRPGGAGRHRQQERDVL